jgi:hypothetical protein
MAKKRGKRLTLEGIYDIILLYKKGNPTGKSTYEKYSKK